MLRNVYVVDTFVAGAFGIGLVLVPGLVFGMYGLHTDGSGEFLARVLGAFVLGWSPLLWWTKDAIDTSTGLAVTRTTAIVDMICTVLTASACLRGIMGPTGWIIVGLFVAFGSVRVYYGFIARPAAATA